MNGLEAAGAWFAGERGEEETARRELLEECPHPLALAMKFDASIVSVPGIELLSRTWVEVLNTPDGRAVMSTPAQIGKTTIARWSVFWALLQDPSRRLVYASYGLGLARDTGHAVREMVESYGAPYGLRLDRTRHDASDWRLERVAGTPHPGRLLCASPESKLTGIPADVIVLDDIYSGEEQAHSAPTLAAVERWWESTVRVRMRPKAPAVTIGTRFAEHDLLARFIDEGWPRINIPALADGRAVDSLDGVAGGRTEDGWLITTRGTTPEDWRRLRADTAERVFASLMQGSPTTPDGNLFKADQWNKVSRDEVPQLVQVVIACDPAETGRGDEAGILVGGRSADGHLYLLADLSGQLAQAQWARRLCLGALVHGAHHILQEKTLGMSSSVRDAWSVLVRQAVALRDHAHDVDRAAVALANSGDRPAAARAELAEIVGLVDDVLGLPSTGPHVQSVTPRQSKRVRAEAVTGLWELGRAHIVGNLPLLEAEAQAWNPDGGGKSPNRVDVMAHLLTHLDGASTPTAVSNPVGRHGAGRAGRVPLRTARNPRTSRSRSRGYAAPRSRR